MPITIDVFEDPMSDAGKVFFIDNRILQFHDLEMYIHEIAGFMYGTIAPYNEQTNAYEGYSTFTIVDTSGDVINISIKSVRETQAEDHRVANEISTAIWKYVGNKLANDMMRAIHSGVEVKVGAITAHRGGIRFENTNAYGTTSKCEIPWEVVGGMYRNGSLMIYSFTDKDCFHWLDLRTVLHAHTLGGVIRMIMADPAMMLILKGQRMPFPYYPPNN